MTTRIGPYRVFALLSALVLLAALVSCAPGTQAPPTSAAKPASTAVAPQSSQTRDLRLAIVSNKGETVVTNTERFAELVKEKSKGKLTVTVYPGGTLGGERDALEGLLLGTIDMTTSSFDIQITHEPRLSVMNLPYLIRDWGHYEKFRQDPLKKEISNLLLESKGIRNLSWVPITFRDTISRRPIKNLADMKGMKIRVPENELHIELWKALGTAPTPLPYTEVYQGLQTGLVEAGEGTINSFFVAKWTELAKNIAITNHMFTVFTVLINEKTYKSLPEDLQLALTEAGAETEVISIAAAKKDKESGLGKAGPAGVTVTELDVAPLLSAVSSMHETFGKKYGTTDIVNRIKAIK